MWIISLSRIIFITVMGKKRSSSSRLYRAVVRHPLTDATLFAEEHSDRCMIAAVRFGEKNTVKGRIAESSSHPDLVKYAGMINQFLDGTIKDLSGLPIDFSRCSVFSAKVLSAARSIPWGKSVSYAQLACLAGSPMAVRAAASVMRNNPFPVIVPCHRVIRSDGSIGGFMGKKSGRAVDLKLRLLARENPAWLKKIKDRNSRQPSS